jgi:hypothetical protein
MRNVSLPLNLKFGLALIRVISYDEETNVVKVKTWLRMVIKFIYLWVRMNLSQKFTTLKFYQKTLGEKPWRCSIDYEQF